MLNADRERDANTGFCGNLEEAYNSRKNSKLSTTELESYNRSKTILNFYPCNETRPISTIESKNDLQNVQNLQTDESRGIVMLKSHKSAHYLEFAKVKGNDVQLTDEEGDHILKMAEMARRMDEKLVEAQQYINKGYGDKLQPISQPTDDLTEEEWLHIQMINEKANAKDLILPINKEIIAVTAVCGLNIQHSFQVNSIDINRATPDEKEFEYRVQVSPAISKPLYDDASNIILNKAPFGKECTKDIERRLRLGKFSVNENEANGKTHNEVVENMMADELSRQKHILNIGNKKINNIQNELSQKKLKIQNKTFAFDLETKSLEKQANVFSVSQKLAHKSGKLENLNVGKVKNMFGVPNITAVMKIVEKLEPKFEKKQQENSISLKPSSGIKTNEIIHDSPVQLQSQKSFQLNQGSCPENAFESYPEENQFKAIAYTITKDSTRFNDEKLANLLNGTEKSITYDSILQFSTGTEKVIDNELNENRTDLMSEICIEQMDLSEAELYIMKIMEKVENELMSDAKMVHHELPKIYDKTTEWRAEEIDRHSKNIRDGFPSSKKGIFVEKEDSTESIIREENEKENEYLQQSSIKKSGSDECESIGERYYEESIRSLFGQSLLSSELSFKSNAGDECHFAKCLNPLLHKKIQRFKNSKKHFKKVMILML